jgi:hypothetical protein
VHDAIFAVAGTCGGRVWVSVSCVCGELAKYTSFVAFRISGHLKGRHTGRGGWSSLLGGSHTGE